MTRRLPYTLRWRQQTKALVFRVYLDDYAEVVAFASREKVCLSQAIRLLVTAGLESWTSSS